MPEEDKENAAGEMARALEQELASKRVTWKRAHERSRVIRQLSLLLFALTIAGAMVALFLIFNRLQETRAELLTTPKQSATP